MTNKTTFFIGLMSELEGTVQGHRDGHGFVVSDDGQSTVYLSQQAMGGVLHRDRVRVKVIRFDRKGRAEGQVMEILDRQQTKVIGRLLNESGGWVLAPEDRRFGQDILIPAKSTAKAQAGQVVCVELTEKPMLGVQPVGRVVEVLGHIDDPGMEIEIAVRKYDVPHMFSDDVLAQAAKLPEKLRPADRKGRIDLRDVPLVTIDGEDARDFDDAVYCEPATIGRAKQPNGWRLLVAIADVSHYVKPGEPLDRDAYERATSVYFPRRVIPMLPEKLSNGLCSLNPQVDRLSMVCDMLITGDGDIHAYQFYPAVICSHARMTYTEVAAIIANTRGPEATRRAQLLPQFMHLYEVYRALLKARAKRGAVDFETTETQIVCDENGRIAKIVPRVRTEAHRLIEEAMLAANVCSAEFIERAKHPALYRVHEGPTPEKKQILRNYIKALGIGVALSEEPTPGEFQAIAQATKDRPDALQIHTMLLRSMQQAIYTPINSGHFGLSYEAYTHFTSPIRRYPDLLVHRVIKALLSSGRYGLVLPPVVSSTSTFGGRGGKSGKPGAASRNGHAALPAAPTKARAKAKCSPEEAQAWEVAGIHCSVNERRADEASRDVEAWLKCMYMRERLGEDYGGTVSTVTAFGLFVQLDNLFVEGLIHITELGGDYYKFDEARQELRGERTGVRYRVGDRVRVQVSRVDLDSRKIDFRMVKESTGLNEGGAKKRSSGGSSAQSRLEEVRLQDREIKRTGKRGAARQPGKSDGVGGSAVSSSISSRSVGGKSAGKGKSSSRGKSGRRS